MALCCPHHSSSSSLDSSLRLSLTELLRHTGLHHAPRLLVSNPNNHLEVGVAQFPDGDTGSEFEQQDQLVGGGAMTRQQPLTDLG